MDFTILFYSGCVNMQKYDYIKKKIFKLMKFLHDTFQIEKKLVVFATDH